MKAWLKLEGVKVAVVEVDIKQPLKSFMKRYPETLDYILKTQIRFEMCASELAPMSDSELFDMLNMM